MTALRSIALAISLLLTTAVGLHAQSPAALPPGMTQEQFDTLVDSISKSVAEKLKAEGVPAAQTPAPAAKSGKGSAAPKAAAAPKSKPPRIEGEEAPDEFAVFFEQAQRVVQ